MTFKAANLSDEKLLHLLKKEIIRLGLEDTPSRLTIKKRYNKENMPSPELYLKRFGSWKSIVERLGFENKRINADTKVHVPFVYWEDRTQEFWIEKLIVELVRVGLNDNPNITDLRKVYDKDNMPNPSTYRDKIGTWKKVLQIIEKDPRITLKNTFEYKRTIGTEELRKQRVLEANAFKTNRGPLSRTKESLTPEETYDKYFPKGPSKPVLIKALLEEIDSKKLYSKAKYTEKYNKTFLPPMSRVYNATNLRWKDIWSLYIAEYGNPILEERAKYKNDLDLFLVKY